MIGLGTLINTAGVVVGGLVGLAVGHRLPARTQDSLMKTAGVAVLFLGIAGAMEGMLVIEGQQLVSRAGMLVILCLCLGSLIGEILNIEQAIEDFGRWLKRVTGSQGDQGFVDAFVTASLTICVGAMAIVGSIQDALMGEPSTLIAKTFLDLMVVVIFTASKGKGAIFAAIPIFLFQGSVTLLATLVSPVMTPAALANLSLVGAILIFCVGLNLVWGSLIKVGNMLPALVLAVAAAFLPFF